MTLLDEFRVYLARSEHWSAPQRIREATMMRTKEQRLATMRQVRDQVCRAAFRAQRPDLRFACDSASRVLSREIGRLTVLTDPAAVSAAMEKVTGLVTTSLGLAVRHNEAEARALGVADAPMLLATACSDT